ncbi:MAG: sugar ABC transporter ATP-binding protein [Planctomycetota bacterium]
MDARSGLGENPASKSFVARRAPDAPPPLSPRKVGLALHGTPNVEAFMTAPFLQMRGIEKSFGGVQALRGVDFDLELGEVVALVGENGAGKSTLAKVLAGIHRPDRGTISLEGATVEIATVHDAIDRGIALIHQELNLADNLDVASNVLLGHEPRRGGSLNLLDRPRLHALARAHLSRTGLDISTRLRVGDLSTGQRQLVEVTRALSLDARLLIMDEPTSSLSLNEVEKLLALIRELQRQRVGIVFVSHRLAEVLAVADRIVVLRDGRNAGTLPRTAASREAIVRLMVGRDITPPERQAPEALSRPVLEVRELRTAEHPLHPLSFAIHAGEIVGLAGLVGAGRSALAKALFGLEGVLGGTVKIDGCPYSPASPSAAIAAGLGFVPEDRTRQGLILEMSIVHNLTLACLARTSRGPFLSESAEGALASGLVEKLSIRLQDLRQKSRDLSGGNQQKLVLARWLALEPRLLILDEPTRGIDVGAKQDIYRLITKLSARGVAVLMISSELEEILLLSHRVLVMHEGRLTGILSQSELSEEAVMQLATGGA